MNLKSSEKSIPRNILLSVILIIILGFAVYGNSLNGEFIWDDGSLVKENIHIRNWSYLPQVFSGSIGAGSGREYNFYRPLQIFTYMIDHSLWKLDSKGYHLTNILLHIFVALSLYGLIYTIFKDNLLSLLTGALFVVHPIHTEVATYISGRADSLALLFMLLCFLLYLKSSLSKNICVFILMLLSYSAALLSKEGSLILPALLALYHYSFKKELKVKAFLSIVSLALIYLFIRATVLKGLLTNDISTTTLLQRLPGFFVAVTTYVRLLVFPFDLHMEYGSKLFDLGDPKAILGAVILIALLVYAFRKKENNRLVFFSIAWFFLALLPVSNLYPINAYMAEHWLYLPSIGFFLITAKAISLLYRIKGSKIFTIIITIVLLTFYSYLTMRQNVFWREPLSFYERTLKYAPDSSRVHSNLGVVYAALDKNDEAIASYKKAIEIEADFEEAYYNLGVVYNASNKKEEAIAAYKKAIESDAEYVRAYSNLGNVYNDLNKTEEAIASYKKAIEIKAGYADAHNNLGVAYNTIDRKEEAIASYKKAIEINPDYTKAHNNLGDVYNDLNRKEEAIASYKRVIEIEPDHAQAYNNLGNVYNILNRKEEAIASYKKAIEIEPDHAEAYSNLGVVYNTGNRKEEAIALYKKAIEAEPDHAQAYNNLGNAYNNLNRKEEAIASYKKAVEIKLDFTDAHNNLGIAYGSLNRQEEAVRAYQQAIAIEPDYAEAHNNLGVAYAAMNRKKEAITAYKKAIKFRPDYANAYFSLGNVYRAMDKREEAAAAYKKATEINPADAEAYYNLGAMYDLMNKQSEAAAAYKTAIKLNPAYDNPQTNESK